MFIKAVLFSLWLTVLKVKGMLYCDFCCQTPKYVEVLFKSYSRWMPANGIAYWCGMITPCLALYPGPAPLPGMVHNSVLCSVLRDSGWGGSLGRLVQEISEPIIRGHDLLLLTWSPQSKPFCIFFLVSPVAYPPFQHDLEKHPFPHLYHNYLSFTLPLVCSVLFW